MNNIIICEGSTDYYLLQYYMREALDWNDDKQIQSNILKIPGQKGFEYTNHYVCRRM